MEKLTITAVTNTFLKKEITQASELKDDKKSEVPAKKSYEVRSIKEVAETSHAFVELEYDAGSWFIFLPHWQLEYDRVFNSPNDINWKDMSMKVSKYFTVGEFLRYDRARVPNDKSTQENIFKIAQELDKIREDWGSPIIITSGYRPPSVNARVGGVRNSRHIVGDAVDIAPQGGHNLRYFESWLDQRWFGALGYGSKKGFVHIDMRNNKGYNTGGAKGPRWNY